jgi:SAM-dependent methyltransferase
MISVIRYTELQPEEISALHRALADYYADPPNSYYEIADQAAAQYQPDLMPFHCDLVSRLSSGLRVLELGCGSAHLCPQIEARGGIYTGIDHSVELLRKNRDRFPRARFFAIGTEVRDTFDIVASLYTIEHVVDPSSYLESMWKFCNPGGLIAVICPDFVDGQGFPPSFYYGKTPRRLREKLASLSIADLIGHIVDLFWLAPRWKARARSSQPGAFWINTRPAELNDKVHGIDTDAVHLPRMTDIAWWFQQRGATIIATSKTLPDVPADVLRYNCYVLARKP